MSTNPKLIHPADTLLVRLDHGSTETEVPRCEPGTGLGRLLHRPDHLADPSVESTDVGGGLGGAKGGATSSSGELLHSGNLTTRARKVLRTRNVHTRGDLERLTIEELCGLKNCGSKTRTELISWANGLGITLAETGTRGPLADAESESSPRAARPRPPTPACATERGRAELATPDNVPMAYVLFRELASLELTAGAARVANRLSLRWLGDLVATSRDELEVLGAGGRAALDDLEALAATHGYQVGSRIPGWLRSNELQVEAKRGVCQAMIRAGGADGGVRGEILAAVNAAMEVDAGPIVSWLGLDQDARPTLQTVSNAQSVAIETIRQLAFKLQRAASALKLELPLLCAAIRTLEQAGPWSFRAAERVLVDAGLAHGPVSPAGLLRCAEWFGVETALETERVDDTWFVGTTSALAWTEVVRGAARCAIDRSGCTTIAAVVSDVATELGAGEGAPSAALVTDVLTSARGFQWLLEAEGLFWLSERDRGRNPLVLAIEKVLAVAPRVKLTEVCGALKRCRSKGAFMPTERLIGALCQQLPGVVVEDGVVVAREPRDPHVVLPGSELTFWKVLGNRVMTLDEMKPRCAEAGVTGSTFTNGLSLSPIVRRVAWGTYRLVGTIGTEADIERAMAAGRRRRGRVVADFGAVEGSHERWMVVRLSAGLLRGGSTSIPAGLKQVLGQRTFAVMVDGAPSPCRLRSNDDALWGLLAFFTRHGGEEGDRLRLTFDLTAGTVAVQWLESEVADEAGAA